MMEDVERQNTRPINAGFFIAFNRLMTGGPRVTLNLVSGLDARRITPVVITNRTSALTDCLKRSGIRVRIVPPPSSVDENDGESLRGTFGEKMRALVAIVSYNLKMYRVFREENIEVLWARGIKGVLLSGLAARAGGIPVIWDFGMESRSKGLVWVLHVIGFVMACAVVAEASAVFNGCFTPWQRRTFRKKLRVIPSGIPEDRVTDLEARKSALANGEFRICCVAALSPRKNQMLLLQACRYLRSEGNNVRLLLVGGTNDEDYARALREYVSSNDLAGSVEFLGWREDIAALFHSSHLFALVSTNEGVPYSMLEAIHAHLPVLATRVGGVPELIQDGENGLLVDSSLDALADRLTWCLNHREVLPRLADNAYKLVQGEYRVASWRKRYEDFLSELAQQRCYAV